MRINLFLLNATGAWVALVALLVLVGFELAKIGRFWSPEPILPIASRASAPGKQIAEQDSDALLASVVQSLRLFNPWENPPIVENKPSPAQESRKVAVAANSELSLIGVMALSRRSWAVMTRKSAPNDQIVLQVGEKVGDATLKRIDRHTVYFDNQGRLERIDMLNDARPGDLPGSPPGDVIHADSLTASQSIARVDYEAMLAKGMRLLTGVRITPYYQNGNLSGYQIVFPGSKSEFQKMGLASNDVIQQIHGIPVTDASQMTQLTGKLKDQSSVRIDLLRESRTLTIELNVEN
ncbi:MAG: hypothetical protein H7833_12100 [Magnetococcus sp. DMHC-1]